MKRKRLFSVVLCIWMLLLLALPVSAANTPVTVRLKVDNKLTGDKPPTSVDFTFVLEAVDDAPMPAENTITISGTGSKSFLPITYTVPDDYHYTIREVDDGKKGYTYDDTVYQVTVQVESDNDGKLTAFVYINEEGSTVKSTSAEFQNKYKASNSSGPPKTGDSFNPSLWIGVSAASLLALTTLFVVAGKKQKRQPK